MKKLILSAFAVVAALSCTADTRIAVVDMLMLVRNHPDYNSNKEIVLSTQKNCNKRVEAVKSEAEELQKEGKKLSEEYRNPMLSSSAKAKIESELASIQQRLYALQQRYASEAANAQRELQDLESVMLKKQTDSIRAKIEVIADREGYSIVADKNSLCYYRKSLDITDAVLKELGVDPAKAVKPGESADESK